MLNQNNSSQKSQLISSSINQTTPLLNSNGVQHGEIFQAIHNNPSTLSRNDLQNMYGFYCDNQAIKSDRLNDQTRALAGILKEYSDIVLNSINSLQTSDILASLQNLGEVIHIIRLYTLDLITQHRTDKDNLVHFLLLQDISMGEICTQIKESLENSHINGESINYFFYSCFLFNRDIIKDLPFENTSTKQEIEQSYNNRSQLLDEISEGLELLLNTPSSLPEAEINREKMMNPMKISLLKDVLDEKYKTALGEFLYIGTQSQLKETKNKVTEILGENIKLESEIDILSQQVTTDSLTGIGNRKAHDERLEALLGEVNRYNKNYYYIAFDIDYFKQVNDSYGHDTGDFALKSLSELLSGKIRTEDMLFRHGGEEFTLLVECKDDNKAAFLAEKIRKIVENNTLKYNGIDFNLTISVGISQLHENDTPESIHKRSDLAMYKAKRNGRNNSYFSDQDGNIIQIEK